MDPDTCKNFVFKCELCRLRYCDLYSLYNHMKTRLHRSVGRCLEKGVKFEQIKESFPEIKYPSGIGNKKSIPFHCDIPECDETDIDKIDSDKLSTKTRKKRLISTRVVKNVSKNNKDEDEDEVNQGDIQQSNPNSSILIIPLKKHTSSQVDHNGGILIKRHCHIGGKRIYTMRSFPNTDPVDIENIKRLLRIEPNEKKMR